MLCLKTGGGFGGAEAFGGRRHLVVAYVIGSLERIAIDLFAISVRSLGQQR